MLAGDIAFSASTLKGLIEQSVNDPESSKTHIEYLEQDIQEKRKQMRVLEKIISESGESSIANSSLVEMQQTVTRLMTQYNEKAFELEMPYGKILLIIQSEVKVAIFLQPHPIQPYQLEIALCRFCYKKLLGSFIMTLHLT